MHEHDIYMFGSSYPTLISGTSKTFRLNARHNGNSKKTQLKYRLRVIMSLSCESRSSMNDSTDYI